MDIIIPPQNIKKFASSITCLGKIGKDLYWSFDPLDGLTLSSLNEAKSAYGKFHFNAGFFQRCGFPPIVGARRSGGRSGRSTLNNDSSDSDETNNNNRNNDNDDSDDDLFYDTRYVCRVPVRTVHSLLRQRKGICSLRIRSEGTDDKGNYFGLVTSKKRKKRRREKRDARRRREEDDNRRGSFSARERRERKRRKRDESRRRNRDEDYDDDEYNDNDDPESISHNTERMMLSFEFILEVPARDRFPGHRMGPKPPPGGGGQFRVLHRVGVTDANGIALSSSVTASRTRSEIIAPPKLLLRLLDPLRRTAEVALTVDDSLGVVTATSFHPGEMRHIMVGNSTNREGDAEGERQENAVLAAAAARNAVLKTETSTGVEEFTEFDFRNNRGKRRRNNENDDSDRGSEEDDDEYDFERERERPPLDVNKKVILVFSIKEAKAMLQFCSQTNANDLDGVILSFHWGGKPIVVETDGDHFTAELVLATLHHGMITSNITVGDNERRRSSGGDDD